MSGVTCRCGGTTFSSGQCMDCGRPLACTYPDCSCSPDAGCVATGLRRGAYGEERACGYEWRPSHRQHAHADEIYTCHLPAGHTGGHIA